MRLAACLLPILALGACKAPAGSALRALDEGTAGFEVRIEGNREISERALLKVIEPNLRDFIDTGYRSFAVDDAAFRLELHYQDEGFPQATVRYELLEGPEGRLVRFDVEEGVRCRYGGAEFEGNTAFRGEALERLVPTRGSGFLGLGPTWLVKGRLDSGRNAIESLYYESGFLSVEVTRLEVRYEEGGAVGIARYRIEEGARHLLDSVHVEGLPAAWGREEVRSAWRDLLGRPWFPRLGFEVRARLEALCSDRGHPDAQASIRVEEHLRTEGGMEVVRIVVQAEVDPGPLVRVRSVEVRGNQKTSTAFIRNRLALRPGDLYSREVVDAAFRQLYRTGIFEQLRIRLEGDDPEERDIVIEVVEGPKWEFWLEPGWGSYEKLRLSAGFLDRNIFGSGRQLGGDASVSALSQDGRLQFTDPTLLGPDHTLRLELYGLHRTEPSFTRIEYGTGVQVRREWTPFLDTIVRYDLRQTRSKDVQGETPDEVDTGSTVDLSMITLSGTYDRRDSRFIPRRGSLTRGAVQFSSGLLGSELDYVRLLGSHFRYLPLGERTTLAAGVRSGILIASEDVNFPIQLRFFNGGENTVRSFREQELGPKGSDGKPLGGEAYNVFNLELRRQLVSQLQGAAFYDVGNVLSSASDYGSFRDLRSGVGVGLRWLLPIGPVRLDFAVNPDPLPEESSYVLHFSLGTAF
jgi:outer membrane protein insertion porin family